MCVKKNIINILGNPHLVNEDGEGEPGKCEYWAYKFECGLVVLLTIYNNTNIEDESLISIKANSFECDHAISHFNWLKVVLKECRVDDYRDVPMGSILWKKFHEFLNPLRYNILRIDDIGNEFAVVEKLPEYQSQCELLRLNAGIHKQYYYRKLLISNQYTANESLHRTEN